MNGVIIYLQEVDKGLIYWFVYVLDLVEYDI